MQATSEVKTTYSVSLDRTELDYLIDELKEGFESGYLTEEDDETLYALLNELKRVALNAGGIVSPNIHITGPACIAGWTGTGQGEHPGRRTSE